jgi:hypothetical protein
MTMAGQTATLSGAGILRLGTNGTVVSYFAGSTEFPRDNFRGTGPTKLHEGHKLHEGQVPLNYMHSIVEMADFGDGEKVIHLMTLFV